MIQAFVEQVATFVQPFADRYDNSRIMVIGVTCMHIGGLLAGGGIAIASDRSILKAGSKDDGARRQVLADVSAAHSFVLFALACVVASGLMFLAADLRTFVSSPVYWFKMSVVAILALNGVRLQNTERRLLAPDPGGSATAPLDAKAWKRLRVSALTSVVAWFTILSCGVVLASG